MVMTCKPATGRYLPISPFQKLMIATALDPETHVGYHQIMTVRWGFRVTPRIAQRTLRRAFDKLVERHDSLRLRFVQDGQDWKAKILPAHPTGLVVEDLSTLSEDAQDAAIAETATSPKTALSDVLFDMHLFICGDRGDVLVTRAHHAIVDGYGMTVLIEDLLKFVLNMPVRHPAMSHEAFVQHLAQETEKNREATVAYWTDRLLPPPPEPMIGSLAKGHPVPSSRIAGPQIILDSVLSDDQSAHLAALSKDSGVSAFSYLHAAFSDVLCDLAGQNEVLINSLIGRQDAALASFIGSEAQEIMVRYSRHPDGVRSTARQVQKDISDAAKATPTDLFFTPDSLISKQVKKTDAHCLRFLVHSYTPSGRLSNSPFAKLFTGAMAGRVSIGFASLERLDWPYEIGFADIYLCVSASGQDPNGAMFAQENAFTPDDLRDISARMAEKLAL